MLVGSLIRMKAAATDAATCCGAKSTHAARGG